MKHPWISCWHQASPESNCGTGVGYEQGASTYALRAAAASTPPPAFNPH